VPVSDIDVEAIRRATFEAGWYARENCLDMMVDDAYRRYLESPYWKDAGTSEEEAACE
jgi:hypothetical protein